MAERRERGLFSGFKEKSGFKVIKLSGAIGASSASLGLFIEGLAEFNAVKVIAGGSALVYSAVRTGIEGKEVIQEFVPGLRRGRSN